MANIFDGTVHLNASTFNISDGDEGTLSVYFKLTGTPVAATVFFGFGSGAIQKFSLNRALDGKIVVVGRDSANAARLLIESSSAPTVGVWHHVLASWDTVASAGKMFIDDVDVTGTTLFASATPINYSALPAQVGGYDAGTFPATRINATIDDLWFDDTFIDLTVEANRRDFIGPLKEQVGLGANGRRPTGSRPILFLTHGPNNYGTNEGTGGSYSIVGSLGFDPGRPATVETLARSHKGERWRESERSGIPFHESRLVIEPATGLEVARREWSTDRDEINRGRRFTSVIFGEGT